MDFAKHKKLFNDTMDSPGVTKKQILNEFQHWFEGSAYKLIEAETLRQDAEAAVDEALEKLTRKFGLRNETAAEMLDEVLQGKAIGAKDHNGLLDFYAKVMSIHSLACETGKGDEFENRTIIKTIIEKKLPHIRDKWIKKEIKHRANGGSRMSFDMFLKFINEEHTFSEMLSRYSDTPNQNKSVANAKVSSTAIGAAAKKDGTSAPRKAASGNCPRCDASHKLEDCEIFRALDTATRRKFCKNQGLCYRCLSPGHMAARCASTIKCSECDTPHHPLLHSTDNGGKAPKETTPNPTKEDAAA